MSEAPQGEQLVALYMLIPKIKKAERQTVNLGEDVNEAAAFYQGLYMFMLDKTLKHSSVTSRFMKRIAPTPEFTNFIHQVAMKPRRQEFIVEVVNGVHIFRFNNRFEWAGFGSIDLVQMKANYVNTFGAFTISSNVASYYHEYRAVVVRESTTIPENVYRSLEVIRSAEAVLIANTNAQFNYMDLGGEYAEVLRTTIMQGDRYASGEIVRIMNPGKEFLNLYMTDTGEENGLRNVSPITDYFAGIYVYNPQPDSSELTYQGFGFINIRENSGIYINTYGEVVSTNFIKFSKKYNIALI